MIEINSPRLGKNWKFIGIINKDDENYISAAMKKYKILFKTTPCHYERLKDEETRGHFRELYVVRGFRRDAMRLMRSLFRSTGKTTSS